jgi:phosphonate metabolism protein (transferase hexapeptide repeat family)
MKRLSAQPTLGDHVSMHNADLGPWTEIGDHCTLENVTMGAYSYCGPFCILQNVSIGRFSNIAAMARLGPTAHPLDRPTLHHFTYRRAAYGLSDNDDEVFFAERAARILTIGHDTWIGHGAIVMPGLAIGTGSVIGAGSVVTRDVEPWTIVAGNPARVIRRRFTPEVAEALERIRWWDWSHEELRERMADFEGDVASFIAAHAPNA